MKLSPTSMIRARPDDVDISSHVLIPISESPMEWNKVAGCCWWKLRPSLPSYACNEEEEVGREHRGIDSVPAGSDCTDHD